MTRTASKLGLVALCLSVLVSTAAEAAQRRKTIHRRSVEAPSTGYGQPVDSFTPAPAVPASGSYGASLAGRNPASSAIP